MEQLTSLGITQSQIKDNEAFIKDFVKQSGGVEAAFGTGQQQQQPARAAPPPAPMARKAPAAPTRRVEPPAAPPSRAAPPIAPPAPPPPRALPFAVFALGFRRSRTASRRSEAPQAPAAPPMRQSIPPPRAFSRLILGVILTGAQRRHLVREALRPGAFLSIAQPLEHQLHLLRRPCRQAERLAHLLLVS